MPTNTLTITDNRTGKSYEVPINEETIRATDLRKIKVNDDDFGLMTYDPAFMNTAACRSAITFIDGDKGILEYRGYPIEQLAEKSTYLETAWLLLKGELPTKDELAGVDAYDHVPHVHQREPQRRSRFVPLQRPPHGHADRHDQRPRHVLPRGQEHL